MQLPSVCELQVLGMSSWHQVAAFQWLTGWPQENLLNPLHGSILGVRFVGVCSGVSCLLYSTVWALHERGLGAVVQQTIPACCQ